MEIDPRNEAHLLYAKLEKPSELDVVTSVFDETGAKMISATRCIFYMQKRRPSELDALAYVTQILNFKARVEHCAFVYKPLSKSYKINQS